MNKDYDKTYKQAYRKKNKRVEFSLSEAEYQALKKIASDLGYGNKVGRLAKQFTLSYQENHYKNNSLVDEGLKKIILILRTIPNNINQISHYSPTLLNAINQYDLLETIAISEKNIKKYIENQKKIADKVKLLQTVDYLNTKLKIQADTINDIAHDTNTFARLDDLNPVFDCIKNINDLIENTIKD